MVRAAWDETAEGPFTFLTGDDIFEPLAAGKKSLSFRSLAQLPRLFPRFADEGAEEEYTRGRNVALVASLSVFCKVWGLMLVICLPFRDWGRVHPLVDSFWLTFWLTSWLLLVVVAIVARHWPGGIPKHFDLWLTLLFLLPFFALLSLTSARIARLLGVPEVPVDAGEVTCVCYVCGFISTVTHLMRLSVQIKFILVHAAAVFYLVSAVWYSDELPTRSIIWVASTMYFQFSICFLGARSVDREIRQHWLLKRAARRELYSLKEEIVQCGPNSKDEADEQGLHTQGPKVRIPHSIQEEAAITLERLRGSLVRLLERGVVKDLPLVELLELCSEQVDDCLGVLRRAAAGRLAHQGLSRGHHLVAVDNSQTFVLDEYMEASLISAGLCNDGPRSSNASSTSLGTSDFDTIFPTDEHADQQQRGSFTSLTSLTSLSEGTQFVGDFAKAISFATATPCSGLGSGLPLDDAWFAALSLEVGKVWEWDALALDRASGGQALFVVGKELLTGPLEAGLLKQQQTMNFLTSLAALYKPNPYHNAVHAADVASAFTCLLRWCDRLWLAPLGPTDRSLAKEVNQTACIIAALAHDVGHPGWNNTFLTNSLAPLAVTYNDNSVLENFHAAVTFGIILRPNSRPFARVERAQFAAFRKLVVDLILTTDIKNHFSDLAAFRLRLTDPTFSLGPTTPTSPPPAPLDAARSRFSEPSGNTTRPVGHVSQDEATRRQRQTAPNVKPLVPNEAPPQLFQPASPEDVRQVQQCLMKAADLGHSAKDWPVHVEWTKRITSEFHNQGDVEQQRGLPIGPLNKREGFSLAKAQSSFLQFVCLPLFIEVAHLDEPQHAGVGFKAVHERCLANLDKWRSSEDPMLD